MNLCKKCGNNDKNKLVIISKIILLESRIQSPINFDISDEVVLDHAAEEQLCVEPVYFRCELCKHKISFARAQKCGMKLNRILIN